MSEFRLPALELKGSATVGRWRKQPGDAFAAHETLLELFSERFDWDILAPSAGVLKEIVAAAGAQVEAGALLALLDAAAAQPLPAAAAPAQAAAAAPPPSPSPARARVSPLAAKIAADRQIDLEQARGSGPDGRVNKDDVLALMEKVDAPPSHSAEPSPPTQVEAAAAARVQTVTSFIAVDMAHAANLRAARRAHWQQREGFELGYLPFVVHATAAALRCAPLGGHTSSLAIEVILASGSALLDHADALNLVGIARRLHGAHGARQHGDGAQPPFVIEDHGSHGALLSTGLLAPGSTALLSVGTVHPQAVAVGEALQTRPTAYLGLTYDPARLDEAAAGKFMAELKRQLETGSAS